MRQDIPASARIAITAERAQRTTLLNADRDARARRTLEAETRLEDALTQLAVVERQLAEANLQLRHTSSQRDRAAALLAESSALGDAADGRAQRAMRERDQALRERREDRRTLDEAMARAEVAEAELSSLRDLANAALANEID